MIIPPLLTITSIVSVCPGNNNFNEIVLKSSFSSFSFPPFFDHPLLRGGPTRLGNLLSLGDDSKSSDSFLRFSSSETSLVGE